MSIITDLLDLEDSDIFISSSQTEGTTKPLTLETHPVAHYFALAVVLKCIPKELRNEQFLIQSYKMDMH